MKTYHIDRPGNIDGLVLREHEIPEPGPYQVLIRIRAVALNFRDLMIINNQYVFPIRAGLIPLSDGAGEVSAVGKAVTRFKVGDRVAPNFLQRWMGGSLIPENMGGDIGGSLEGVFSEYVLFNEDGVVKLPSHLSFEEGATLACAGTTAWVGLTGQSALYPGDVVLVQGTGGVSIFALQFAKLFGARVIATTSTQAKAERLKSLGADHVINYVDTPDWDRQVLELTGGRGVDRVIEVGGPGTIERSCRCTRVGGRISLIGFVAGAAGSIDPFAILARAVSIDSIAAGSRRDFEDMNRAIEAHALKPVVDRIFAFDAARDAYRHLSERLHVGKVVVSV